MLSIYLCGPTVYQDVHIGNVRPIIVFDLVVRARRAIGQSVFFVHNITDIDDKIVARAAAAKVSELTLATTYYQAYRKVLRALNVSAPSAYPRVTANLPTIIKFIKRIIAANGAYVTNDGVYFAVTPLATYGSVSGQNINMLRSATTKPGTLKRSPHDFALWKIVADGVKYDSPWGAGRPGWHTECAALIDKYFQHEPVAIHGGGIDLIFPHHENENAQFLVANGVPIANEWRHIGTLNFAGTKMSKSLGNIILAKDFIAEHGPDTARFIFFSSNYAAPLELSAVLIAQAVTQVARLKSVFMRAQVVLTAAEMELSDLPRVNAMASHVGNFDFAPALRILNEIITSFEKNHTLELAIEVVHSLRVLGFNFTRKKVTATDRALIAKWSALRANKEYKKADKYRNILHKKGLV